MVLIRLNNLFKKMEEEALVEFNGNKKWYEGVPTESNNLVKYCDNEFILKANLDRVFSYFIQCIVIFKENSQRYNSKRRINSLSVGILNVIKESIKLSMYLEYKTCNHKEIMLDNVKSLYREIFNTGGVNTFNLTQKHIEKLIKLERNLNDLKDMKTFLIHFNNVCENLRTNYIDEDSGYGSLNLYISELLKEEV